MEEKCSLNSFSMFVSTPCWQMWFLCGKVKHKEFLDKYGDHRNLVRRTVRKNHEKRADPMASGEIAAVHSLVENKFLFKPVRCEHCDRGHLSTITRSTGRGTHVEYKCTQWDCRRRTNALSCSYGLPKTLSRGLKPSQVLMALRMWTNTKTSPCPSAVQVAKAVGAGRSAVEELLKPLQSVEVAAGQTLCETLRFDSKATESN